MDWIQFTQTSIPDIGGDLAPSWGNETNFSPTKVSNDLFMKRISIFAPKISDDLF